MSDEVPLNEQTMVDDAMDQSFVSAGSYTTTESEPEKKFPTEAEKQDIDSRSIYVGNVDYDSTPLELQQHFAIAGVVNRVTIQMNKQTGQSKGFAYIEFETTESVDNAVASLDGSTFRDRELKVSAKRTNIPGLGARGSSRGRGRGRGGFRGGRAGFRGGRGGRAGFRGRGRGESRFSPY